MSLFRRPDNTPRMNRMAEAVGVDLKAEVQCGSLTSYELRLAATRCGECCGERECTIWLQARNHSAEKAPGFCPNRTLYEDLQMKD